ncbi:MAG TPA: UDP-2,4-diacetamido-2,4,6-trideoxy-beta-L-altropyranose hydrolase [Dongiaceae bacterium]|jgi:UDP-2,4-diacetamido-2,4,6-trideoxy-beta-L-altropyranose hydrolase|nr:UDP-2,4-diacetamido-2,4,6-trideoxy-beta-L-altropyranose hydrolase [Dongiaceae bacterium]
MRFAFRVDASLSIGTGHVMRCLTLADELRRRGAETHFLCRDEPGNLIALIGSRGHQTETLASGEDDAKQCVAHLHRTKPDWVILDHYGLGKEWERAVRPYAGRVFAIDDLADREHDCDLLLDQNLYDGVEQHYASLVPGHCRQLIGPRFALLRPEFAKARNKLSREAGPISRVLVNFGGVDSTNETARILRLLHDLLPQSVAIDAVLGPANPHAAAIKSIDFAGRRVSVHVGINNMAELMSKADAFVGAGGSTTWERFCLGLPSLVIAVAENQVPTAQYLGKLGAIDYIGKAADLTGDSLRASLARFLMDQEGRSRMAKLGMDLVDGKGVERVAECLLNDARA